MIALYVEASAHLLAIAERECIKDNDVKIVEMKGFDVLKYITLNVDIFLWVFKSIDFKVSFSPFCVGLIKGLI
jgi:hypothetical protein